MSQTHDVPLSRVQEPGPTTMVLARSNMLNCAVRAMQRGGDYALHYLVWHYSYLYNKSRLDLRLSKSLDHDL